MKIKKIILSVVSGVLIVLCFPKFNLFFLAWISLLPLLFSINQEKPSSVFLYGLLTGIISFCGIIYWIVPLFKTAGESPVIGIICLFLLSAACAVFFGIFCATANYFKFSPVILSCLWAVLEYVRTVIFSGFPWALLGYSQWSFLPLIQIVRFTGIYGISFIIVLVNLTVFKLLTIQDNKNAPARLKIAVPALIVLSVYLLYGFLSVDSKHPEGTTVKIAILQGNIDQYKKWSEAYRSEIMDAYASLIHRAAKDSKPDLIVWPEAAMPGYVLNNRMLYKWTKALIDESKCYHLIGADEYREKKLFNSILFFSPEGILLDSYSKIHLVPFGEAIPFKDILARYIRVLNELGDFSPGRRYTVFKASSVPIGANVCFESIFPDISRKLTKNGAQILFNLTNDGWYLKTAAPYQHFIFNIFRAVENNRMVVRSANTGISGLIDEHGRIVAKSGIFERLFLNVSVRPIDRVTFYTRFGDVFTSICFVIVIIAALRNSGLKIIR